MTTGFHFLALYGISEIVPSPLHAEKTMREPIGFLLGVGISLLASIR